MALRSSIDPFVWSADPSPDCVRLRGLIDHGLLRACNECGHCEMVTQSSGLRGSKDLKDSGVTGRKFLHCGDLAGYLRFYVLSPSRNVIAF